MRFAASSSSAALTSLACLRVENRAQSLSLHLVLCLHLLLLLCAVLAHFPRTAQRDAAASATASPGPAAPSRSPSACLQLRHPRPPDRIEFWIIHDDKVDVKSEGWWCELWPVARLAGASFHG